VRGFSRVLLLSIFLDCAISDNAPFITRADEFKRSTAKSVAIIMSGRPELNNQTPIAARMTDKFVAMSFREHSKTELIFISSCRWSQSRYRHKPFATRPARLKILITSYKGRTGVISLLIIWAITRQAAKKIKPPLNRAT